MEISSVGAEGPWPLAGWPPSGKSVKIFRRAGNHLHVHGRRCRGGRGGGGRGRGLDRSGQFRGGLQLPARLRAAPFPETQPPKSQRPGFQRPAPPAISAGAGIVPTGASGSAADASTGSAGAAGFPIRHGRRGNADSRGVRRGRAGLPTPAAAQAIPEANSKE